MTSIIETTTPQAASHFVPGNVDVFAAVDINLPYETRFFWPIYIVTRGIRGMAKPPPLTRFCETPCVFCIWQKVSQVQNVQYVKKKLLSTKGGKSLSSS